MKKQLLSLAYLSLLPLSIPITCLKKTLSNELNPLVPIGLVVQRQGVTCPICHGPIKETDRLYLCANHRDHPWCLFERLRKNPTLRNADLINVFFTDHAKDYKLDCLPCLQKYRIGPVCRQQLYHDCITELEALAPADRLSRLADAPRYLVTKTLNSLDLEITKKYFIGLTREQQRLFLLKITPKDWQKYLSALNDEKLINDDPVLNFMPQEKETRIKLFTQCDLGTQKTLLIAFWPDITEEEQESYLKQFANATLEKDLSWLFLSLSNNHELSSKELEYLLDELLISRLNQVSPAIIVSFFSQRMPVDISYQYAKKIIKLLPELPNRLKVLEGIWALLEPDGKSELFEEACAKADDKTDHDLLIPFIVSLPPEHAYNNFKNLMDIYCKTPIIQAALIRAIAPALPSKYRILILETILLVEGWIYEKEIIAQLCKNLPTRTIKKYALTILQKTNSTKKMLIFLQNAAGNYDLNTITELFNAIIKVPKIDVQAHILAEKCKLLTGLTGTDSFVFQATKKLACSPIKQAKFLEEIAIYPFFTKQRVTLIKDFLNHPHIGLEKKIAVFSAHINGHQNFYPEKHAQFTQLSTMLSNEAVELLSHDLDANGRQFLVNIWTVSDKKNRCEYFAYMTEKNRILLDTLKVKNGNLPSERLASSEELVEMRNNLVTWFSTRPKEEKLKRIYLLPPTIFESFYESISDNEKIERFKKLEPANRMSMLERLKKRSDWSFFGKHLSEIFTIDDPIKLFFYPSSLEAIKFLEKSTITLEFIDKLKPHWDWLERDEKEILFCKSCNQDIYKLFFPQIKGPTEIYKKLEAPVLPTPLKVEK